MAAEDDAAFKEFVEKSQQCKDKLGISDEEAEEAHKAHQNGEEIDGKFKCFAHCIAEEMDVLDGTGKFDVAKMEAKHAMSGDELEKINECKGEHDMENDDCEYSYKMMGCLMSK